jgi:hypothetical protein
MKPANRSLTCALSMVISAVDGGVARGARSSDE